MKLFITLCLFLFVFSASAQTPVKAPKNNGRYELKQNKYVVESGECKNGYKIGTWTYYGNYGVKNREEDYDENGILLSTRQISLGAVFTEQYTLVKGVYSGEYKSYSEYSGFIAVKGWYANGSKDSTWFFYRTINKASNLWKTEKWQNGKCREREIFYPTGKVFRSDRVNESDSICHYFDSAGNSIDNRVWTSVQDSLMIDSISKLVDPTDSDIRLLIKENMAAFYNNEQPNVFLMNNTKYPNEAKENGIQGTVYVAFEINTYGDMQNFKIKKSDPQNKVLEEEALRVVQMMPPWQPYSIGGRYKTIAMTIPVRFIIR